MTARTPDEFPSGRPSEHGHDDAGYVLISAIAVTGIALMLGLTVATASISASLASGQNRQRTSSIAAAEAGLDLVQGQLAAAPNGAWPCGSPQTLTVSNGIDSSQITLTLQYLTAANAATTCSASPASVLVTSTAVATTPLQSGNPAHRTMQARFVLASASPPPATTVRKAIFGNAGVTAQNQLFVYESSPGAQDGNIYSNSGSITCNSTGTVQGSITTQANLILRNTCATSGPVWAAGTVDASASVQIAGDVYAAASSSPAISLANSARIAGNAFTNGDVTLGDASVGGSVLSTQGKITFQNGAHIDGSAYARLGLLYSTGGGGTVARDVVASAGSIASGMTSLNPGEYYWSIGGNAAASPSGCIANTVTITGSKSPAQKAPGQSCTLPASALTPTTSFPATANNPAGMGTPTLPATVSPPGIQPFPTLYAGNNPATGADALDAWRSAGWDVHIFTGSGTTACTNAMAYLKAAETGTGTEHTAWAAQPLAIVVRGCSSPLQWDQNNRELMGGTSTFTLFNDLAVIADGGMTNQNGFTYASNAATTRSLLWIVPTDSPAAPTCTWGTLTPSNIAATNVSWFLFTPCAVTTMNAFGTQAAPIAGAIYGGTVTSPQTYLRFAPLQVPGLDDGSQTTSTTPSVTLAYKREITS